MSTDITTTTTGFISRIPAEVYEAIADPTQLSQYFTTGGAQGRLLASETVTWDFADFPGAFPVQVVATTPPEKIELLWGEAGDLHDVSFTFEPIDEGTRTKVTISESSFEFSDPGVQAALGNQMGWTGMLAALKAWLEYGINLREGFYK
ncbi:SRPBCC domain-containing protein [Corynebacterium callunae]